MGRNIYVAGWTSVFVGDVFMSMSRLQVIRILKELKQKYPEKELDQLVELANYYALLHQQKSRAFYRVQVPKRCPCPRLKAHSSRFPYSSSLSPRPWRRHEWWSALATSWRSTRPTTPAAPQWPTRKLQRKTTWRCAAASLLKVPTVSAWRTAAFWLCLSSVKVMTQKCSNELLVTRHKGFYNSSLQHWLVWGFRKHLIHKVSVSLMSTLQGVWDRTLSMWITGQRTGQQTPGQITITVRERSYSNLETHVRRLRWVKRRKWPFFKSYLGKR